MNCTHKCNHGCEHKRVKFCKDCGKVHCLDCGHEWPETEIVTYPYIYRHPYEVQPSYPWPTITWGGNTGEAVSGSEITSGGRIQ